MGVSKNQDRLEARRERVRKKVRNLHGRHRGNVETEQCTADDGHRGDDIDVSDHVAHDEGRRPRVRGKRDAKQRSREEGEKFEDIRNPWAGAVDSSTFLSL